MNQLKYLILGLVLGIIFVKSEVISWFRIQEMFRFESFHMYGIIGSAVILGVIGVYLIKRYKVKNIHGQQIFISAKNKSIPRYLFGGILFGLGWSMTGACPGPMFTLLGTGYMSFIVVIASAILGTFVYGIIRHKLPH